MEKINIVYVDDCIDIALSRYLDHYKQDDFEIEYSEVQFNPQDTYEQLIINTAVTTANIIFIDSRLFENRNAINGKFTGEEFKLVLKKYYPFIEVIVITQNDVDDDLGIIKKYDSQDKSNSADAYYSACLPQHIKAAISNIKTYRKLSKKLVSNDNWENILKEKIINSLKGINTYDELTKADIDQLVSTFKEIQEKLDEWL